MYMYVYPSSGGLSITFDNIHLRGRSAYIGIVSFLHNHTSQTITHAYIMSVHSPLGLTDTLLYMCMYHKCI